MKRFQAHDYRLDDEPVNWPLLVVVGVLMTAVGWEFLVLALVTLP